MTDGQWIVSGVPESEARNFLERFSPWRMLLQFESGPRSDEHETFEPFNRWPLHKLKTVLPHVDLPSCPRVLDIGFNCGYNALHMAKDCGATTIGIDVVKRHKDVADELAQMTSTEAKFLLESAEEYCEPESFDLVLHFGTLYHLKNPLRSLDMVGKSLKRGGWLALETMRFEHEDPALCKWVHGLHGDKTTFWALGVQAITEALEINGLPMVEKVTDIVPKGSNGAFRRIIWIARRN